MSVSSYMPSDEHPLPVATIEEDQVLHGPDGNQAKRSKDRSLHTFARENGGWQIYDDKKL